VIVKTLSTLVSGELNVNSQSKLGLSEDLLACCYYTILGNDFVTVKGINC
jgi:hypothetical protein